MTHSFDLSAKEIAMLGLTEVNLTKMLPPAKVKNKFLSYFGNRVVQD